ncbi:hypothetical protein ACA40_13835 [Pseudomonas syringae pv. lapsa]|uniref:hypothetical protein n=1 Tax=Pseudomonas syringae TaxID=317 RepID=UPI00070B83C2|nr:hypothetical protein [Pseudomonas syringae]ALU60886.1 hypothetical protein ACA40_13835 [Pseudomonas syringae pv. lapsa]
MFKLLFKANDDNGDIHHLNAFYNSHEDKNDGLPPLYVKDMSGDDVTQGISPSGHPLRGIFILKDGRKLETDDKYAPW